MVKLLNRAKMSISSTGTGPITLAAAVVNFQTFAQAGALDGNVVRYGIQDGADAWEVGTAVMSNSATVMARTVNESSNGGNALNLTSSAVVFGTLSAADFSDNAAPSFSNTIPDTLELAAGVTSTINAKALDDDGFPITYSFDAFSGNTVYSASQYTSAIYFNYDRSNNRSFLVSRNLKFIWRWISKSQGSCERWRQNSHEESALQPVISSIVWP